MWNSKSCCDFVRNNAHFKYTKTVSISFTIWANKKTSSTLFIASNIPRCRRGDSLRITWTVTSRRNQKRKWPIAITAAYYAEQHQRFTVCFVHRSPVSCDSPLEIRPRLDRLAWRCRPAGPTRPTRSCAKCDAWSYRIGSWANRVKSRSRMRKL